MGIRSESLSSALTQIRSPHWPLLNSTTWRTLGGTATRTLLEPSALTRQNKRRNKQIKAHCSIYMQKNERRKVFTVLKKEKLSDCV